MTTPDYMVGIPDYVTEALSLIRDMGIINMFDRGGVMHYMREMGEDDAADWISANKNRYMDALHTIGSPKH